MFTVPRNREYRPGDNGRQYAVLVEGWITRSYGGKENAARWQSGWFIADRSAVEKRYIVGRVAPFTTVRFDSNFIHVEPGSLPLRSIVKLRK